MKLLQSRNKGSLAMVVLLLLISSFTGCSRVGPAYLKAGIGLYNEAINSTDAQQTLLTIVRNRYGESSTTLAVDAITANIRVSTNANINVGIGSDASFAGNLVPFSAGAVYEENPTISYTPVRGRKYLRQMRSPIPLDLLALLTSAGSPQAFPLMFIVRKINDIINPDFVTSPSTETDARFSRLLELMARLNSGGFLFLVHDPHKHFEYSLVIRSPAKAGVKEVHEFLTLLDIPWPDNESSDIILPIVMAMEKSTPDSVAIQTRSLSDLVDILSSSIDVPQMDIKSGVAVKFPPPSLIGRKLHITSSQTRPSNSSVTVKYRGMWFSIDETDQSTKMAFRIVQVLHSVMIAEASGNVQTAPVLTIPVSR